MRRACVTSSSPSARLHAGTTAHHGTGTRCTTATRRHRLAPCRAARNTAGPRLTSAFAATPASTIG